MTAWEHTGQQIPGIACAVITVSDTRTVETDASGRLIEERLTSAGHRVVVYEIIPDEPEGIGGRIRALCSAEEVRAILLSGGTGVAPRDTTYEALGRLFEKRLDGFGELFRMLSYGQIGPHSMISRATAGVRNRVAIFAMPGAPAAVELALDKLIVPTLGHIVWLLTR